MKPCEWCLFEGHQLCLPSRGLWNCFEVSSSRWKETNRRRWVGDETVVGTYELMVSYDNFGSLTMIQIGD